MDQVCRCGCAVHGQMHLLQFAVARKQFLSVGCWFEFFATHAHCAGHLQFSRSFKLWSFHKQVCVCEFVYHTLGLNIYL